MARNDQIKIGQGKYCSRNCSGKAGYKAVLAKTPMDKENNPNWKGGISKNHVHYKNLYAKRHPIKHRAHKITSLAIRRGKLIKQPCEVCGEIEVHAHHDDYSKPLIVRWLCRKHHMEHHKADSGTH